MEEGDFISSVTAWIAISNGPIGNTDFAVGLFLGFSVSSSGTPSRQSSDFSGVRPSFLQ